MHVGGVYTVKTLIQGGTSLYLEEIPALAWGPSEFELVESAPEEKPRPKLKDLGIGAVIRVGDDVWVYAVPDQQYSPYFLSLLTKEEPSWRCANRWANRPLFVDEFEILFEGVKE